jgi:hypothetical protein
MQQIQAVARSSGKAGKYKTHALVNGKPRCGGGPGAVGQAGWQGDLFGGVQAVDCLACLRCLAADLARQKDSIQ